MSARAADIAKIACKLHDEKRLSDRELTRILEGCINLAALENGYADVHGLPFPRLRPQRPRHAKRSRRAP